MFKIDMQHMSRISIRILLVIHMFKITIFPIALEGSNIFEF